MKSTRVLLAMLAAAALMWGCSQPGTPVSPLRPQVSPPQAPSGPVEFPPLSKPGRIFGSPVPLVEPASFWTLNSRFVLYNDATFALQYGTTFENKGRYSELGGELVFRFDGNRASPEDGAAGTLTNDTLTVRYGQLMIMSDFEDAAYTLVR